MVLGQVLRLLQDVEVQPWAVARAVARYEKVAEFCRTAEDPTTLANVLTNLGNLHYHNRSWTSAANCHLEAMSVRRRAGDVRGVAQSLVNLGNVARRRADPGQAATDYDLAAKLFRDLDDRYGEAQALENLGLAHLAGRNVRAGRAAWQAAADCFAADGHTEESERLRRAVARLGRRRERRALVQSLADQTAPFGAGMFAGASGWDADGPSGGSGQGAHDGDQDLEHDHGDHIGDGHSFDAARDHDPQHTIDIEHTDPVPDHGGDYGVMPTITTSMTMIRTTTGTERIVRRAGGGRCADGA